MQCCICLIQVGANFLDGCGGWSHICPRCEKDIKESDALMNKITQLDDIVNTIRKEFKE